MHIIVHLKKKKIGFIMEISIKILRIIIPKNYVTINRWFFAAVHGVKTSAKPVRTET